MTRLSQYYDEVLQRFRQNGNRLFLVDDSKNFQAEALSRLLTDCGATSAVVVTADLATAREYAQLLSNESRSFAVAESADWLTSAFGVEDMASISRAAGNLRRSYPWLVVPLQGSDAVLFAPIDTDARSSGTYYYNNKTVHGVLRIIDVVAEARYSAVAVDEVYRFIALKEKRTVAADKLNPVDFDRVDFCGREFYQDTSMSYKKLKNLVDSAQNAVLLSDCIADSDTVGLYAALNLLNQAFNYYTAKEAFARAFDDYDGSISATFGDIIDAHDDEYVVAACFSAASATDLVIPKSSAAMGELISSSIDFMSEEETVLRALFAYSKMYRRGALSQGLVDSMIGNEDEMGKCLCALLFADEMKGELDDITESRLSKIDDATYSFALKLFNKHGGIYLDRGAAPKCGVVQITCEGSGFEYLYRSKELDCPGALDWCTLGDHLDDATKCEAVARLVDDVKVGLPMLVVTNGSCEEIAREIGKLAGKATNLSLQAEQAPITVINYDELHRTAADPHPGSVVFYDLPYELARFGRYLNKVGDFGAQAFLLSGFGDLSSRMLRIWSDINNGVDRTLPLNCYEVTLKDDRVVRVGDALEALDKLVKQLDLVASGRASEELTESVLNVINGYTPDLPNETAVSRDMGFLREVGVPFGAVFGNSVTVGGQGEVFSRGKPNGKPRILFNVCSRMLMRSCRLEANDCNGCPLYKPLLHNNFEAYSKAADGFVKSVKDYCTEVFNSAKESTVTVYSADSYNDAELYRGVMSKNDANKATIKKQSFDTESSNLFATDFARVEQCRRAVGDVYNTVLDKYLCLVKDVCDEIAEKLGKLIGTLQRGYKL